jgi:syntaxin-binding protein 1
VSGFNSALQSIPPGQWKVLITDDHSRRLLDAVYKEFDVLQQNVTCEWEWGGTADSERNGQ